MRALTFDLTRPTLAERTVCVHSRTPPSPFDCTAAVMRTEARLPARSMARYCFCWR